MAAAGAPGWLTARPIAHRGLHDAGRGIIENTLSAAEAAIRHGFAIECDVQRAADGEAVVFHDFTLDRLTAGTGPVDACTAAGLAGIAMTGTTDRIVPFAAFLAHVAGRTPVICEIKSRFDGDMRLADRTAEVVAAQDGPVALKSFDPAVVAHLRRARAGLAERSTPLGIVGEVRYDDPEWERLSPAAKFALANFLHYRETLPDFLSYHVDDLPHAVPFLCRHAAGLPVLAWTVRTAAQRRRAAEHADQMVFEGFVP